MEKICIVKRRKREFHKSNDYPGTADYAEMSGTGHLTEAEDNQVVSPLRDYEGPVVPKGDFSADSERMFSIILTPQQSESIQSNDGLNTLLSEASGDVALDIQQGENGQYVFNFYLQSPHTLRMLKPDEVCDMLQISKSFLTKLIKDKRIRSYKIGRLRRFSLEDVLGYLTKSEEM